MAHINTTGHHGIDTATAEIAVALRNACRVMCSEQDHYEEAVALRDAIMAGTRELDDHGEPFKFTHGSDEASDDRNLREHTEATASGSQDYLWRWLEHGQDEA